jgi:hypothetical protein
MGTMFLTYVAGILTQTWAHKGRLDDALSEKEHYRGEVERLAEAKRKCEERLVQRRLSSAPANPKKKGGR